MNKVWLTDKELYLTWAIVCWFNKPATSTLKYKLAGMANSPDRHRYAKRYDTAIEDRIIELGKQLEARRLEQKAAA